MNSTPLAVPGRCRTVTSPHARELPVVQRRQLFGRLQVVIAQYRQRMPAEGEAHRAVVRHDLRSLGG
ncbi:MULTISPECIES: hypothetical protein [unclassified Burkholderia]|uniref:hypothetical protein n=1 Tax=Burkholderia sp. BE17 TaxID=2656644 RepID=UPI00187B98ED